ncbi:hypothetical protein [Streptomyces alboflavus]|uniref:hypothetical protein n=1 Tax=Streptomyces alboflavus TaxID=67267 RepID=UPI000F6582AA|nr:hypothetical protein [Streptomyces alboflavus]
MSYTHMAIGLSPNIFDLRVEVEWTPKAWGVRLTLKDKGDLVIRRTIEAPNVSVMSVSLSDSDLNDAVMQILDSVRLSCERPEWIDDKATVAYELADHDDFVWGLEKWAK